MKKRMTTISSLERGADQYVNLGNGFEFKKDAPVNGFYSYTVRKNGDLVEAGSANTLKELKEAAFAAKREYA